MTKHLTLAPIDTRKPTEILTATSRNQNPDRITAEADRWLKDLLELAERGIELKDTSDNQWFKVQISIITSGVQWLANDALKLLLDTNF